MSADRPQDHPATDDTSAVVDLKVVRAGCRAHGFQPQGRIAPEEEQLLIEAFRRELDAGLWAAVPTASRDGRREAELVKSFDEVPRDAERVIFFPRAAGGAPSPGGGDPERTAS